MKRTLMLRNWDQAFGAAVLAGDYSRLATCSLDVPDATTGGQAVKAWERGDNGIYLIKRSYRADGAELMGAKLASELCALLFGEDCYVLLEIVERYGRPNTANPFMLTSEEEFADGNRFFAMAGAQGSPDLIEDRITTEEAYAPYEEMPSIFGWLIAGLFKMQRGYVNRVALEGK